MKLNEFTYLYQKEKLLLAKVGEMTMEQVKDFLTKGNIKGTVRIEYMLAEKPGCHEEEKYIYKLQFLKNGILTGLIKPFYCSPQNSS